MKRLVTLLILWFAVNGMSGTETGDRRQDRNPSFSVLRQTLQKAPDEWIAYDKAQHLTASMILTGMMTYRLQHISDWRQDSSLRTGAGLTFGLGVLKEISDLRKPFPYNRFSLKDLVADLAGIALGVLLLGWW